MSDDATDDPYSPLLVVQQAADPAGAPSPVSRAQTHGAPDDIGPGFSAAWRQLSGKYWLAVAVMTWASFCFGMLFGSMSPVLAAPDACESSPMLLNCDLALSAATLSSWLLVGPAATVVLGPIGGGMLDRSGHKKMMLCGGLAYVVGWAVYCLTPGLNGLWVAPDDGLGSASGSASLVGPMEMPYALAFIFAGRLLTWGGFGMVCGVPAIYLAEVTPPQLRGAVGTSTQFAVMLGTLAEFGAGAFVSSWRILYCLNGVAFVPVLLMVLLTPTSPHWLRQRAIKLRSLGNQHPVFEQVQQYAGGDQSAAPDWAPAKSRQRPRVAGAGADLVTRAQEAAVRAALRQIYADSNDREARVDWELNNIVAATTKESDESSSEQGHDERDKSLPLSALWTQRQPIAMCAALAVTMQLCPGGTVAVLFSGPILEGFAPNSRNLVATLCNIAALPGCVLALVLVDRLGRLKLLVASTVAQAAAAAALAFFFIVKDRDLDIGVRSVDLKGMGFGALAFIQFSYTLGWGSVTGVLMSELAPSEARGLGLAIAQSAGALTNSAVSSAFIPLASTVGWDTMFATMGVILLCLGLGIGVWLPETANHRLEEIQTIMTAAGTGTRGDNSDAPLLAEAKKTIDKLQARIVHLETDLARANASIDRLTRR